VKRSPNRARESRIADTRMMSIPSSVVPGAGAEVLRRARGPRDRRCPGPTSRAGFHIRRAALAGRGRSLQRPGIYSTVTDLARLPGLIHVSFHA